MPLLIILSFIYSSGILVQVCLCVIYVHPPGDNVFNKGVGVGEGDKAT